MFAFLKLGVYGLVIGAVAMLLYKWISPQKKLLALKEELARAQRELKAYKGTDGREVMRLSKAAVAPALKQMLLVIGPAIISMAPVLLTMYGLSSVYQTHIAQGSGPSWLYAWETPYMIGLTISAIVMKFALKIA